jgi:hypothetical protein
MLAVYKCTAGMFVKNVLPLYMIFELCDSVTHSLHP